MTVPYLDPHLEACEHDLNLQASLNLQTWQPVLNLLWKTLACVQLFPLYGGGHTTLPFRLQHQLNLHSLWNSGSCHFEGSKSNLNLNYNSHVGHYDDIYMLFPDTIF